MKCVKSVLGEFSSGVSMCPNKRPQIWWPLFTRPSRSGYGELFLCLCLHLQGNNIH